MKTNTLVLVFSLLSVFTCANQRHAQPSPDKTLVFKGEILAVAPPPAIVSGVVVTYRLAKYKIVRVCRGEYREATIVVDHPFLKGNELAENKIGDTLWVAVSIRDRIPGRMNAPGIREESEPVSRFFVASSVSKDPPSGCHD